VSVNVYQFFLPTMDDLTPVTLVVKAPNQKIGDQTIECALDWTVKKLKQHLSSVYPSKPVSVCISVTLLWVMCCLHIQILW